MTEAYVTSSQPGNTFLTCIFASPLRPPAQAPPGSSAGGPDQALLDHRDHQESIFCEDLPRGKPSRRAGERRFLRVQQPPVGAERPVEPHRVIQARPAGPPV